MTNSTGTANAIYRSPADILRDRINNDFAYHPATPVTGPLHDEVRRLFRKLALDVVDMAPAGRAQGMAITCLQEAMMWTNSAIACDTPTNTVESSG